MEMVNIKINGMPFSVPNGISILEAARYAGIEIPTLCFLKEINEIGACRICMVEVKGARSLVSACVFPVNEGMEIFTNTKRVRDSRKTTLELILFAESTCGAVNDTLTAGDAGEFLKISLKGRSDAGIKTTCVCADNRYSLIVAGSDAAAAKDTLRVITNHVNH